MSKLILLMLLTAASSNAMAEWLPLSKSVEGYFYANQDTLQRNGNIVSMWTMADYKNPKFVQVGSMYKSIKEHGEYDCIGGLTRKLALEVYVGNMGFGTLLRRDTSIDQWTPVSPGSITELMWKYACGKMQ